MSGREVIAIFGALSASQRKRQFINQRTAFDDASPNPLLILGDPDLSLVGTTPGAWWREKRPLFSIIESSPSSGQQRENH
jgi:hypothetical protein